MNTTCRILVSCFVLAVLSADRAAAMPATGRVLVGSVQKVNPAERSAVLVPHDGSAPREFTWVPRTVVFAGGLDACPAEIREGMVVRIVRHVPVFGPPFVTRVNLPASALRPACASCSTK